jgi:hypothetical protein
MANLLFYRKAAFAGPQSDGHAVNVASRAGAVKRFEAKTVGERARVGLDERCITMDIPTLYRSA